MSINWVALGVFIAFFLLVTVLGFVAARWRPRATARMGARRSSVRDDHHLVSARRRLRYGLYRHRRPGGGVRDGSGGFLRASVYDHRLSDRLHDHAALVERRQAA